MELFTIGHSNHPIERFLALLARHGVDAVADVRSTPGSRRHPQYGRQRLEAALADAGIAYVFLGRELGARPADPAHDHEGRVDFARLAESAPFQEGIARVLSGAERYRLALLCAEREPLDCHRTLLVARVLVERGAVVRHILADGALEPHIETETRLLERTKLHPPPLLDDPAARGEALARAYEKRSRQIAYRRKQK